MMPRDASLSLKVVATDTLSMTASTATPARISRSFSGTPSFSYMAMSSGSTSARLFGAPSFADFGAA
jgi:putative salt-induced outer membrane protein YdiY